MTDNESDSSEFQESVVSESAALLRDLTNRSQILLSELRAFKLCLDSNSAIQQVESGYFRKNVESEVKSLETISRHRIFQDDDTVDADVVQTGTNTLHALKSSNLPFYEAVWQIAKTHHGITALSKRIALISEKPKPRRRGRGHGKADKYGVIDIVAQNGLEWVKISTVNEKRLLFDIAKEGWATYGDDSDIDSADEHQTPSTTSLSDELELVKLAHNLCRAARIYRVRHRHPHVTFAFPKLREGDNPQIDAILAKIRAAGATIQCASTLDRNGIAASLGRLEVTHQPDFMSLVPLSSTASLTSTINIDCTVLLALISDISHVPRDSIPPYPNNKSNTYHTAILKQIQVEQTYPFVPNELYPILQGRQLVCTNHAAERMHQIVRTMGTADERLRSYISFGLNEYSQNTRVQLLDALRAVSCHSVPDDLHLPIQVVKFNNFASAFSPPPFTKSTTVDNSISQHDSLPSPRMSPRDRNIATRINQAEKLPASNTSTITNHNTTHIPSDQKRPSPPLLSQINSSVFLYGWSHAITTITSNKVVVSQLRKRIDDLLDYDEQQQQENKTGLNGDVGGEGEGDADIKHGDEEFTGPLIYICDTARSLVGKEKQGQVVAESATVGGEED